MQELLNEAEEESLVPVGERPTVPTTAVDVSPTGERTPRIPSPRTAPSTEPPEQLLVSPVDVFGLHQERFKDE
ncbi:hypothetical protein F441_06952 [Phytophthora nicotianae CJ01A1]|uniref:Uncharacterized protein n=1 Tax=Phytophthora nicotianae CJ01A1 TaxID=1317063 RepID=W2XAE2_PHYNI|nr:hypothetical protein F441_06952 [Phytophthora nicotianae CJ01A1]